jgi:hypothetical protein
VENGGVAGLFGPGGVLLIGRGRRLAFNIPISDPDSGFWVRSGSRAFARISSRTLGWYVAVTNPTPHRCRSNGFQRISVALQTPPKEPRQRNGPLGAPKRRPDLPQAVRRKAETTALGPTGAHLGGGLPGGGAPAAGALSRVKTFRAVPKGASFHQVENPTAPCA